MSTSIDCYPWWHAKFEPLRQAKQIKLNSGCVVNSSGNVPCEPQDMRRAAEMQLQAAGYLSSLSLETYTLARYMQGEVGGGAGGGTLEEAVAVGEAAVNRAKLEGKKDANSILLYRQAPSHPNYGWYGPIHGFGGTTTAPYGRWATTHVDPTVLAVMLADLVTSGKSGNFSRGADDQDGLEYSANFPNVEGYVNNLASRSKFWVGLLPGVNHWRTFLQTTIKGETNKTPKGIARVQYTMSVLANDMAVTGKRAMAHPWPKDMPICARPGGLLAAAGILGATAGIIAFNQGWLGRFGKPV